MIHTQLTNTPLKKTESDRVFEYRAAVYYYLEKFTYEIGINKSIGDFSIGAGIRYCEDRFNLKAQLNYQPKQAKLSPYMNLAVPIEEFSSCDIGIGLSYQIKWHNIALEPIVGWLWGSEGSTLRIGFSIGY